jgi:hypothetical protein
MPCPYSKSVIMHVGGRRFEFTFRIEMREAPRAPTKVIEMA